MRAVGTVSVSPSTSLPYFPLGSQETEVKVAAGALRTVHFDRRWDEHATSAGLGPPASTSRWMLAR